MDPKDVASLLRRRWLLLVFFMAVGASLGYASTLVGEDEERPVIDYWTASERLVLDPEADTRIDFQATAVFAVSGDIPEALAAQRGVAPEDLISQIRVVSDATEATLTISAVAADIEDARDIAAAITDAFLERLRSRGRAGYDQQLGDAEALVAERVAELAAAEAEVDALETLAARPLLGDDEEPLTDAQEADLRSLRAARDVALTQLTAAEEAAAQLRRTGPPAVPLVPLDTIAPFRISEREYRAWVAKGRQGQNNFSVGEVDLADTSSPTVSERLESPAARAGLGAIAGLVLAMMLVGIHHRLDPRLRSREQIENAFGLPVLTMVPNFGRKDRKTDVLHTRDKPQSAVSEAYRYLRSVLLFARSGMTAAAADDSGADAISDPASLNGERPEREVRVVMITSAGEGEGKTTTAVNLAALLAESGYDTILINCDFRLPSAHKAFGMPYAPGAVNATGVANLRFVADVERTEGDTPGEVSERQRRLIRWAREEADVVVLDTAPLLATNDAIDILPETDLVVMVAREGKTTSAAAAESRELLIDRIGVPVAGVAVTAAGAGLGGGYYERYRYGNYFQNDNANLASVARGLFKRHRSTSDVPPTPQAASSPAANIDEPHATPSLEAASPSWRQRRRTRRAQRAEDRAGAKAARKAKDLEPELLEADADPEYVPLHAEVDPATADSERSEVEPAPEPVDPDPADDPDPPPTAEPVHAGAVPTDTAVAAPAPPPAAPEPTAVPKLNGEHGSKAGGPIRSALPAAADPELDIDLRLDEWFERRERPPGDVDLREHRPDRVD